MTCAGASGDTKTQMATALQFDPNNAGIHAAIKDMNAQLRASGLESDTFKLKIDNSLWIDTSFKLNDDFMNTVKTNYSAEINSSNFSGQPEVERIRINDSVAKSTENLIKDLIPRSGINAFTQAVLVNAIYLKGKWTHPFKKEKTHPQDFKTGITTVQAEMMHTDGNFKMAETKDYTAVEMSYVGDKFALLAILPSGDVNSLENSLSADLLKSIRESLKGTQIDLAFPKFEIKHKEEMRPLLENLGIKDAFDRDRADFTHMGTINPGAGRLKIDEVIHDARIIVDEEGTEAAAATAATMMGTSMAQPEKKKITFDRPFVYLLWHKETGTVLFLGRVMNPIAGVS